MPKAEGSFVVNLTPQPPDERPGARFLGRLLIEKTFAGGLHGHKRRADALEPFGRRRLGWLCRH